MDYIHLHMVALTHLSLLIQFSGQLFYYYNRLVLPFFQDYEAAGEFDMKGKIKHSIKINLAIILGVGAVGVIFIVYLLIKGSVSWY